MGCWVNYKTNQRSVELQLMRRFISDLQVHDMPIPTGHLSIEDLSFLTEDDGAGTLRDISLLHSAQYLDIVQASGNALTSYPLELWSYLDIYQPGGVMSSEMIEEPELSCLAQCYCTMYPTEQYTSSKISAAAQKYSQIKVCNEIFGSQNSRSKRSSYVLAKWCGRNGIIDTSCLRPACISYFIKHSVMVSGSFRAHYFAVVRWFEHHPSRNLLGDPVELWCHDLYESLGPASYLPVQRIHTKFVAAKDKFNEETLLVVMPLQQKVFL